MTPGYIRYIETSRALAECHGLDWNMHVDEKGQVSRETQWSLNQMLEVPPPPRFALSHLGTDAKTQALLKQPTQVPLSEAWQSLIKAAVVEAAYTKKTSPGHIYGTVVRSLKVLASCCFDKEPWEINSNDLSKAVKVAEKLQTTGQLKQTVEATAKTIFDPNHISKYTPIFSMKRITTGRQQKTVKIRASVEERKDAAKLPEYKAFWELVRIIYQETPMSFFDAIRFEMIKLMILLGLRGTEVTTLPLDWRRQRDYFTTSGQRADESGGIGCSIQVRHFAEKQRAADRRGVLLSPSVIDVPAIFEDAVVDALERVEALTSGIRATLEGQVKGDRIISDLEPSSSIEIHELYTALTGEPFLKAGSNEQRHIETYFKELNPQIFEEIKAEQLILPKSALKNKVRQYFSRLSAAVQAPLPYRTYPGDPNVTLKKGYLKNSYLKVEDAEEIIRRAMPTKLSDTASFNVEGGETLEAHECLFLAPKRSLIEGRNGGICDTTRFLFIGRVTIQDLDVFLSKASCTGSETIFERYGGNDAAKLLSIRPHDLRHLMNTELFRQGVSDTIISKRFNRKSVAQSYEYDHRSLAEDLDRITIPDEISPLLYGKAEQVYKLIETGKAQGPIVRQFREIKAKEGDEAAVVFLAAEADGFHLTPYGGCINSFVAEPCPNHLECFNDCRHLIRLGLSFEDEALTKLLQRYERLLSSLDDHPAPTEAKANMKDHAVQRIAAIQKLLSAPPGKAVFPDGVDNFRSLDSSDRGPFRDA